MVKINIIATVNNDNVIGSGNDLLIESNDDMKYFYKITTQTHNNYKNVCIMGRNTWESIPIEHRPLKGRINIVLTRNHSIKKTDNVLYMGSLHDAISWCDMNETGKVFIIGGQQIYTECFIDKYDIELLYLTHFDYKTPSNLRDLKFFPDILQYFQEIYTDSKNLKCKVVHQKTVNIKTDFKIYQHKDTVNLQELEYLTLLNKISYINLSESRNSDVSSSFGERLEFDLSKGLPLLTSKKMGFKTILRELLWFINGSTCNKKLNDVNVHIWDQNASKEFLASRNLDYKEGDLGPIYGFQWRHYGAKYIDSDTDYTNEGIDQLKYIIDMIKNDPTSRRIIMNAWNPCDLEKMALPPCHIMCQFHVDQINKKLDCQMYQRSGDMFLGVPFNIASYSLLTYIIAHLTGYNVGRFIHILGDAHIYNSHMDAVKLQVKNPTHHFPELIISDKLTDIDTIEESYFEINNYQSSARINAPMIS